MNSRVDQCKEGQVGYYDKRTTLLLNHSRLISNWVQRNDREVSRSKRRSEFGRSGMGNEVEKFEYPIRDFSGSVKPRPILDQWNGDRNGPVAFHEQGRGIEEWRRFPIPSYAEVGPSKYRHGLFHGYDEQRRTHRDFDGTIRVENWEHERAELIRKLDELKEEIIRCCDLAEKPRERVPPPPSPPLHPDRYFGQDSYVQESSTGLYTVSFAPDKYVPEPLYFTPNHQPVHYNNIRGLDRQDFPSPESKIRNEVVVYDSSNLPQTLQRPPRQAPPQYLMQHYHDHFSGQPMDSNHSTLASRQHETFSHQISCSCLQCYDTKRKFPPQVPRKSYNSQDSNSSLESFIIRNPKTRSSIEIDLGIGGVAHRNPTRVVSAHGSERACHPVAGGAPFLTCCSCFELLKLPRKLVVMGKNQQKVRCGACSSILLVEFEKHRVIVTVSQVQKQVSIKGDDGSGETLSENLQSSRNHSNAGAKDSWSDDFDNSGFKFPLTDTEVTKANVMSSDQSLDFGESIERKEPLTSTSSISEDEHSPDIVIFQEISISSTVPPKDDESLPFSDSLDQNEPKNDSPSSVVSRYENQEKVILDRSTSEQNCVEDVSVATEIEVASHELLNCSTSQDSAVVRKEDHARINEVASNASAFSCSCSSQSVETERSNDLDNFDYKSLLKDTEVTEANVLSNDQRQSSGESIEKKEDLSSTSSFFEDEHGPDTVIFQRELSFSSNVPPEDDVPLPLLDSSNVVSRYEDQEKFILNGTISPQNFVEDVSVATEIEVPSHELLNSSVSQDSAVVLKEEDRPRINKLVSNASTVYFSFSSRSAETERSDDSDSSDYKSPLTETNVTLANVLSSDQRQNFSESIERKEPLSSTSSISEDEHSPDMVICQREISLSSTVPPEDDVPFPFSYSPDQNEQYNVVSRYANQEKGILDRSTSQHNSVKDVSVATEIEVASHEVLNSSMSQDSAVERKEEDHPTINEVVNDARTGSFSFSSQSVETERPNVFVNGQPLSDRMVKKAENLSGPIEPGNYWYDYQGGFWGVMGQPCLGIIPPFIEEFKYPMPEGCAAGNTGVFVNRRELNHKDLALLAARGLPTTRDKHYVIEICGTVLDENTGKKLYSLGKLAPTEGRDVLYTPVPAGTRGSERTYRSLRALTPLRYVRANYLTGIFLLGPVLGVLVYLCMIEMHLASIEH